MDILDLETLERCESLFVAARGEDVPLSCPARVHSEAQRGRRVLVVALFEPRSLTAGRAFFFDAYLEAQQSQAQPLFSKTI